MAYWLGTANELTSPAQLRPGTERPQAPGGVRNSLDPQFVDIADPSGEDVHQNFPPRPFNLASERSSFPQ
jgi:hypothetical protein